MILCYSLEYLQLYLHNTAISQVHETVRHRLNKLNIKIPARGEEDKFAGSFTKKTWPSNHWLKSAINAMTLIRFQVTAGRKRLKADNIIKAEARINFNPMKETISEIGRDAVSARKPALTNS